jgi:hypothetical protein
MDPPHMRLQHSRPVSQGWSRSRQAAASASASLAASSSALPSLVPASVASAPASTGVATLSSSPQATAPIVTSTMEERKSRPSQSGRRLTGTLQRRTASANTRVFRRHSYLAAEERTIGSRGADSLRTASTPLCPRPSRSVGASPCSRRTRPCSWPSRDSSRPCARDRPASRRPRWASPSRTGRGPRARRPRPNRPSREAARAPLRPPAFHRSQVIHGRWR